MKRWIAVAAPAAALVASVPPARAGVDEATAESLMRESGLWQQLGDVAEGVRDGLDEMMTQGTSKPEPAETARLKHLIDDAFSADRLRVVARQVIEKETSEVHVAALLEWFTSPSGNAITKAEIAAPHGQGGLEKLKKDGIVLLESMSASRRSMLDAIVSASRSAEFWATISIHSTLAVMGGIARANPGQPMPPESELSSQLQAARPAMEQALSTNFLETYASVYKKVPDARLEQYVKVLTSPAGRHLTDVAGKAIEAAMVDGAKRFGRDLLPGGGQATT